MENGRRCPDKGVWMFSVTQSKITDIKNALLIVVITLAENQLDLSGVLVKLLPYDYNRGSVS